MFKNNFTFSRLLFIGAALFLLSSCAPDNEDLGDSEIDQELTEALLDAANGRGIQHFVLPNSNDFSDIPQDPRNRLNAAKVELGKRLFHETGLATIGRVEGASTTYSCASCHFAGAGFQAGRVQGIGEGGMGFGTNGEGRMINSEFDRADIDVQPIRTPAALNSAYQEAMLWNGQFGAVGVNAGTEANWTPGTPKETNELGYEGLEIQAIAGLQVHRLDPENDLCLSMYENLFETAFPDFPFGERISRETAGLAIAAYERTLLSNQAPFQKWLAGNTSAMDEAQKRGAVVFFKEANCAHCHNGPALNDMNFHALGMGDLDHSAEELVMPIMVEDGIRLGRGGFTQKAEDNFKFKTPQLYNLANSPFYGHGGTFKSIEEVVRYKNQAVSENQNVPVQQISSKFIPQQLSEEQIRDLVDFLTYGLNDPDLLRYQPSSIPSGHCFPNNDPMSRADIGCD